MKLGSMLAGALLTLAPAATALAQSQGDYGYEGSRAPTVTRQRWETALRVVPPEDGTVILYDGARLIARIEQPGVVMLPSGRTYGVVATRGGHRLWSGPITASGGNLSMSWEQSYQDRDQDLDDEEPRPGVRYYLEPPSCTHR